MKRISTWALYNKRQAVALMVILKIVLLSLCYILSQIITDLGYILTNHVVWLGILLFAIASLSYPDARQKKVYFERGYYIRQKLCDFSIAASCAIVFTGLFSSSLFHSTVSAANIKPEAKAAIVSNKTMSKKEKRTFKRMVVQQSKLFFKHSGVYADTKSKTGWKLALAIGTMVVVTAGLAVLACAISCNGAEVAAIVLLVVGVGGIAWLLTKWIKNIYKKQSVNPPLTE